MRAFMHAYMHLYMCIASPRDDNAGTSEGSRLNLPTKKHQADPPTSTFTSTTTSTTSTTAGTPVPMAASAPASSPASSTPGGLGIMLSNEHNGACVCVCRYVCVRARMSCWVCKTDAGSYVCVCALLLGRRGVWAVWLGTCQRHVGSQACMTCPHVTCMCPPPHMTCMCPHPHIMCARCSLLLALRLWRLRAKRRIVVYVYLDHIRTRI